MYTATALLTAISLFLGYLPGTTERAPAPTAASTDYELLDRGAYTDEDGREISFAIWREGGQVQADVSILDPASGDTLELWLDGETVRFEGIHAGEPFSGAEPASTFFDTNPDAPTCLGWVALVCLGGAVLLASSSGCVLLDACVPIDDTKEPDGGGGVPDGDPGEGGGGDGDD